MLVVALFSDGTGPIPALGHHRRRAADVADLDDLGLLAVLGLRDKVIFLAARGEVYASFTVAFLFAGYGVDMIIAAKLVCLVIWLGAATSKLNRHFPFVISTMMSNNPVFRPRWIKRRFFETLPRRPAARPAVPDSRAFQHRDRDAGAVGAVLLPRGWPTAIAAFVMLCFHFGILSAIPMGVPLEWNVFMIFCVLTLFVGHAGVGLSDMPHRCRSAVRVLAGTVVLGNLFPRKVSFLPGMRYYAGNWDTALWCIKPSAEREDRTRTSSSIASMPAAQMETVYGSPETAQMYLYMGYAFRCFNSHGKARCSRSRTAQWPASNEDDYVITDGERLCSTAIGWNFGDGHMHNEQLIDAMQERCHFEPGEIRVVLLDAQPIPPAEAGVPARRCCHRRIRKRLRERRRHGDAAAVGRRRPRARDVAEGQR